MYQSNGRQRRPSENMDMKRLCHGFLLAASLVSTDVMAADAVRGKGLFASCAACHGPEARGNPELQAPALAGQEAAYLERQLRNFAAGVRGADAADVPGARMRGAVGVLADDAAVADVSAYLATLAPAPGKSAAGADLRNGSNYYQSKCGACHGGRAEGNASLFAPRLAGQDVGYLARQYLNFQKGLRGAAPEDRYGRQMKLMTAALPPGKDLDDVLGFIAAQGAAE
jgi:cytochrome c553